MTPRPQDFKTSGPRRVVIIGGGFGGVYTGLHLAKSARRAGIALDLTLVSRENYIVFQPLLPDVISGAIETLHVVSPIRRLIPGVRLITREIQGIDLEKRTVTLGPGVHPELMTIEYDDLVIGLGTVLDAGKVPGMAEHGLSFKYLGDALRLRHHLVDTLEEADIEADPEERQRLLTFVVAGGGFSGVECMAELHDFVQSAVRAFRTIALAECRFILLQSADRILPEMAPGLAQFAHRILSRRGVDIRLNVRLSAVTAQGATLIDGATKAASVIPSRTTVVTVPAGPHPLIKALPCTLDRGRLLVDECLRVPGWPGVWAVGDCAAVPQEGGQFSPPTAQHATRQARRCAENLVASVQNRPLVPFRFPGLGKMGSLGHRQAVAEVFGVKLSGFLAWMLWRGTYLSKLPGWDRKIRVLADWVFDLFLPRDITQLRIFPPRDLRREHFEAGEIVFRQGDLGDKLYFIVEGRAEVVKAERVEATLGTGDMFGELALVARLPRSATIRAASSLTVVSMSREAFEHLIAHLPGMRDTMQGVIARYANRLPPNV